LVAAFSVLVPGEIFFFRVAGFSEGAADIFVEAEEEDGGFRVLLEVFGLFVLGHGFFFDIF